MTTGRINQVTILKPPAARGSQQQVVRFAKKYDSFAQHKHTGLVARRLVFMTCNQLDIDYQSTYQLFEV